LLMKTLLKNGGDFGAHVIQRQNSLPLLVAKQKIFVHQ
jgi:hypothetical protein